MSSEIVLFSSTFLFSAIGVYLNLCYQRATHRSTVYTRFLGRNMRFLSVAQICLACSNVVFAAAMWGSRGNRTRKSEAFFSTTLAISRALPAVTIFWVTLERLIYNRFPAFRDVSKFRYIAIFRAAQILISIAMEFVLRALFEPVLEAEREEAIEKAKNETESTGEEIIIKNSLIANYYLDYYHATLLIWSSIVFLAIYNVSRGSYTRAGLLGGMRNDQKIQNLASQLDFFKYSYIALYGACLVDFLVQLIVKRGVGLDDATVDAVYILTRTILPVLYPLSLISCHKNLRADYIANILLCRKARNLHKESKVKVIATRESQESIIANLKMIGILSDVDTVPPGGLPGMPQVVTGHTMSRTTSISKDPTSSTSTGSGAKSSGGTSAGPMMFTTRPKHSVPSMGSVG